MTIYRVIDDLYQAQGDNQEPKECFTRIRIEEIEFQDAPATAVYFEEVTKNI